MTAQHTPGPWVSNAKTGNILSDASAASACIIANTRNNGLDFGQESANAHLIAAAPDLFRALTLIRERACEIECDETGHNLGPTEALEAMKHSGRIAKAAIAKARGE